MSGLSRRDFRNILLIKPSAIGDVVHALPVLSALRRRHPAARITWLVSSGCADIPADHPDLDELITFDRKRFGRMATSPSISGEFFGFVEDLRSRKFDLTIDLQGLFRSGFLSWASGAATRVGLSTARELAWVFYTNTVDVGSMETHAVDRLWAVARALGCEGPPPAFRIAGSPEADVETDAMLRELGVDPSQGCCVMASGAQWVTKQWSLERFAQTAAEINRKHGMRSLLIAAAGDAERCRRIAELSGGAAVSLAGRTTLRQAVSLLRRARLVVSNDSGPMHIAAALGRPLVSIFGPTNPNRTGPYGRMDTVVRAGVACSPCYSRHCPTQHECLAGVTVEMVMAVADRELARTESTLGFETRELPQPMVEQAPSVADRFAMSV